VDGTKVRISISLPLGCLGSDGPMRDLTMERARKVTVNHGKVFMDVDVDAQKLLELLNGESDSTERPS
jgi:hypothetical protein